MDSWRFPSSFIGVIVRPVRRMKATRSSGSNPGDIKI
nr:MAG TPA: hypothetical protein [Crassvirales sp.]